jgi:hypothetical protein
MSSVTFTAYVTKHACTRGILTAEARLIDKGPNVHATVETPWAGIRESMWLFPDEVFTSLPDAIADAERRRAESIAKLEHQLAFVRSIDLSRALP